MEPRLERVSERARHYATSVQSTRHSPKAGASVRFSDGVGQPTAPLGPDQGGSRPRDGIGFAASARGDFGVETPPTRRSSAPLTDSAANPPDSKPAPRSRSPKGYPRPEEGLRRGRPRFCPHCGGVMAKSTRMVLSAGAAFLLILMGVLFMGTYGFATNFLQTPWFIKFALPAMYYVGSLFVGVGILFFFIREKVWRCEHCREVRKR